MFLNCYKNIKKHFLHLWYVHHQRHLFHRLTRTAYLQIGCLPWYNVVLTSQVHSSVKYSQQSELRTRATVE